MVDGQPNLRDDLQLRQAHEHVEGIGDAAVRRVLQRHDSEVGMAAVDLFEHSGDATDLHELDRSAEPLNGSQMTEAILGAEVRDLDDLLQGPRATHNLTENCPYRAGIEWSFVGLEDILKDLLFSGR